MQQLPSTTLPSQGRDVTLDVITKVLLLVLTEVSKATARYLEARTSYTLINIPGYLT